MIYDHQQTLLISTRPLNITNCRKFRTSWRRRVCVIKTTKRKHKESEWWDLFIYESDVCVALVGRQTFWVSPSSYVLCMTLSTNRCCLPVKHLVPSSNLSWGYLGVACLGTLAPFLNLNFQNDAPLYSYVMHSALYICIHISIHTDTKMYKQTHTYLLLFNFDASVGAHKACIEHA